MPCLLCSSGAQLFNSRATPFPNSAVLYSIVHLCHENAVKAHWSILFMRQSCSVRHAQLHLHIATLSCMSSTANQQWQPLLVILQVGLMQSIFSGLGRVVGVCKCVCLAVCVFISGQLTLELNEL